MAGIGGRRGAVTNNKTDNRRKDYVARTPFQEWLKPFFDANSQSGKTPSNYIELAEILNQRDVDVSEIYIYKVTRGNPEKDASARRPGFDVCKAIGEVMGDVKGALESAGYGSEEKPLFVASIKGNNPPREVTEDTLQIVAAYEGLPPGPLRQEAREYIKGLQEIAQRAYSRRTDILGKTDHDAEGDLERIPDRG